MPRRMRGTLFPSLGVVYSARSMNGITYDGKQPVDQVASSIGKHSVPVRATHSNKKGGDNMTKSTCSKGGGKGGGKSGSGGKAGWPAKTGNLSGKGRDNAPARGGKGK